MAGKTERVVVTISIDTECDHDINWARSKPLAFESIHEGLPNRLQPLFSDVGAIPSYLLTVEVLEDARCIDTLNSLQGRYEYGTHLHSAFVEPNKKYFDYAGVACPEFQCNNSEEIEYQKLKNLTNLFTEEMGFVPTSFRAGRYGAGEQTLRSLEKLGYLVDTSVTPRLLWKESDGNVDFRRAPLQPYTPAHDNISAGMPMDARRILEVPVTIKPRIIHRTPLWFRPWFSDVNAMKSIARFHINKFKDSQVINLNMMFHSMEIIEKASPYPQTSSDVKKFLDNMHSVLLWCKQEGFEFAGLTDLHKIYKSQG